MLSRISLGRACLDWRQGKKGQGGVKNLRAWRERQDMNSLLGPPLGAPGLGEGQPRTKVTVSLLPWKRPPLNREPGKRWRKGVPGGPRVRTEKMRETVS